MKNDLSALPNIGPVLRKRLAEAGIETPDQLRSVGTEEVFRRLRAADEGACVNELYAIEGAIRGIRWHSLDEGRKKELREFHSSLRTPR